MIWELTGNDEIAADFNNCLCDGTFCENVVWLMICKRLDRIADALEALASEK
ncbi:MAG: hypothetical protein LUD14_06540 [Clostridiales bacterium]|nr:hypothetical protein [Clostridiales bacterium]